MKIFFRRYVKIKASKKIALGITVAVVVLACLASLVFWRSGYLPQRWRECILLVLWEQGIDDAQHRRVLLLCKTDHQGLLNAGREILSRVPKDRLNPRPGGPRTLGEFGVPEGVQFPQAIRDLKCGCLISYDGYLTLEMHGGMTHFGVRIYPEDYEKPDRYFKYGDRELLTGLWYYDDGYVNNPEYDKWIEGLIEEHKGTADPALPDG